MELVDTTYEQIKQLEELIDEGQRSLAKLKHRLVELKFHHGELMDLLHKGELLRKQHKDGKQGAD